MERILMKGNEALAEAAIRAGCRCFFGYPITPQTELSAYMAKNMEKSGGVFLQAESEISAVNMVLGAASAGVRAMTSSSSPGISLKSEGISYLSGSDLPCLIVNVQRGGPGLGSIQPAQSDYFQATRAMGHGDHRILVYAPASVQEMADFARIAFDAADKYRIPAMILADGLLGQMMEPVTFHEPVTKIPDRSGWKTSGHENKREHHIINSLFLDAATLENKINERFKRYELIKENETLAEEYMCSDAVIVVAAYGSVARIARSAVDSVRKKGIKAGLFRPETLWPFPVKELNKAVSKAENILVAEMSMGQMVEDIRLSVNCKIPVRFFGRTGGVVPTPDEIAIQIEKIAGGNKNG